MKKQVKAWLPDSGWSLRPLFGGMIAGLLALMSVLPAQAGIIAENVAVEAFASPNPPDMGFAQGDIDMAGRRWSWRRTVSPTDQPGLVRMDVAVLLEGRETAALSLVRDTGA